MVEAAGVEPATGSTAARYKAGQEVSNLGQIGGRKSDRPNGLPQRLRSKAGQTRYQRDQPWTQVEHNKSTTIGRRPRPGDRGGQPTARWVGPRGGLRASDDAGGESPARTSGRGRGLAGTDHVHEERHSRSGARRSGKETLAELTKSPVTTLLPPEDTLIVARDIARAKGKAPFDRGEPIPACFKDRPIYHAGPAGTPPGMPSGSFRPTTAGRAGSASVRSAAPPRCSRRRTSTRSRCWSTPSSWSRQSTGSQVVDFPAFILINDKGND